MKVSISNGRSLHEKTARHIGVGTFEIGERFVQITVKTDGSYSVSEGETYTNNNGVDDARFRRVHEGNFQEVTA